MSRHERRGLRARCENPLAQARGEARDPQHPHRVLDEGFGHMAQQPRGQIALPAVGIHDVACGILGHGVDGEIAALQVLLEA